MNLSNLLCVMCCCTVHCRCPPEFISVAQNQTVNAGTDVELFCHYISGDAVHVTWIKHYKVNGSYVDDNEQPHFDTLTVGDLQHSLHFAHCTVLR